MREQTANRASTTLAAGYTAGAASISVTSAADFPTAGSFRVKLGNAQGTLLRVTAVSGTTFSVVAEAFDANASGGDTVDAVITAGAVDDLEPRRGDGLDQSGFSWVNQGGASVNQAEGIVGLRIPNQTTNIRARVKSAPSTPWTVKARFTVLQYTADAQYGGLVLRESGTGKLYIYYSLAGSFRLQAVKFSDPSTFSAVGLNKFLYPGNGAPHWIGIEDDGTDLHFLASADGVNWVDMGTEGRTVFMAGGPDQVGLFGNGDSNPGEFVVSLHTWTEE